MADELMETTLLVIRECFVYKIPIRGAAGFKAADWDLPNPLWTGRLVVKGKGEQAFVKLEDSSTGDVFAVCPVTEASIEPVNDSSRYYVLKIEDGQKRHAFIGIGFTERDEAFNFSAALQDHARFVKQERESAKAEKELSNRPHVDYSLKQGEKITVNISGSSSTRKSRPQASGGNEGGFSGLLPPPPGSKSKVLSPQPQHNHSQNSPQQQSNSSFNQSNDPFAEFAAPKPQQQQFSSPPQQNFNNSSDPFASFGFSSPPQQQKPQQQNNNPFGDFNF